MSQVSAAKLLFLVSSPLIAMGEEDTEDDEIGSAAPTRLIIGATISFTIACIGTITNTISITYFLRRKNKNLGDKYLVFLNMVDMAICIYSAFATSMSLCGEKACRLPKNSRAYSFTLFEVFIELSGVATCFLCALRAISISRPLYQISKRKVYISTALAVFYIIAGKSITFALKFQGSLDKEDGEKGEAHVSTTMKLSLVNISIMIIFVMICLIVSIRGLKKTRPERAGEGTDTNEKATKMILILGIIFLAFNTTWMAVITYYTVVDWKMRNAGNSEELEGKFLRDEIHTISFISMSINSATNPIVYMTRNEEMNGHIRRLFGRVKTKICGRRNSIK